MGATKNGRVGAVLVDSPSGLCRLAGDGETHAMMNGIQYVTDEQGRKIAVQIDLRKHRGLWEDIADVLVSRSRRAEERVPLATVKARLVKSGKLARG